MNTLDDRGVSSALSYALIAGITAVLVTGLAFGASSLVEERQEQVVSDGMSVVGHELAASITTASELAATEAEPSTVSITHDFPDRIAGSQYRIIVVPENANAIPGDGPGPSLRIESRAHNTVVRISVRTAVNPRTSAPVDVRTGSPVNGGRLEVAYDSSTDQIVIRHA